MEKFTIQKPDDFHVHLRQGERLKKVLPYTAKHFGRALIMPNTEPPVLTADDATKYAFEIGKAFYDMGLPMGNFEPLFTIQITDKTTPEIIINAKKTGVIAGKVYPMGVTHNSHNGVSDFKKLEAVFAKMEEVGMVLCLHGESPDPRIFCLDREYYFIHDTLVMLAYSFPKLKIVLEHISTAEAVDVVTKLHSNVAATITVHHLYLTLNNVIGDKLEPHHFCKPIAKRIEDQDALIRAAISGDHKFFLGTDSAPHMRGDKECASGCAGIFSAPVALSLLAGLFEEYDALDRLEGFTSKFGARFYGLPENNDTITLVKKPWTVPEEYHGIVPFMAGKTLSWQVEE